MHYRRTGGTYFNGTDPGVLRERVWDKKRLNLARAFCLGRAMDTNDSISKTANSTRYVVERIVLQFGEPHLCPILYRPAGYATRCRQNVNFNPELNLAG